MKKIELVSGCYYHIYNRGVDKRCIFMDEADYRRFVNYLSDFNTLNCVTNYSYRGQTSIEQRTSIKKEQLVDVVSFILIPNHFHLILCQLVDNGISKFMQKIETGYVMYFNKKNERTGRLYESKFKTKLIETDEYLMHLSRYIHLNCLDLIEPNWKEEGIKDWDKTNEFLENYKWSSYLEYIGKINFPYIINKQLLQGYFKTSEEYKEFIKSWVVDDIDVLQKEALPIE